MVCCNNEMLGNTTERVTQRSACGVPGEFERRVVGALAQRITCIYRSAATRLARRDQGLDLNEGNWAGRDMPTLNRRVAAQSRSHVGKRCTLCAITGKH